MILALRQVAGPRSIRVLSSVAEGGEIFVVFDVDGEDRRFAWLEDQGSRWEIGDVTGPGVWPQVPAAGSNEALLLPMQATRTAAVGGFVDPSLTRIEVIDGSGHLVDAATPEDGAVAVLAEDWGQSRVFRGSDLVGASGVTSGAFPPIEEVNEDAVAIARDFVDLLRAGQVGKASEILSSKLPPDRFLPPLRDLVMKEIDEVRSAEASAGTVIFQVVARAGDAQLALSMTLEGRAWRVWQYAYGLR